MAAIHAPAPQDASPVAETFAAAVAAAAAKERTSAAPAHSLDLPSLLPLSRDHPLLSAPDFDVDAFLLSRIHIPLEEARGELREYLAVLREELVQLINDDYEEFISLGTGLRGEGTRLEGLVGPLGRLKGEVEEHQNAVQAKLDERSALREEKALLDLLQRLFDTLTRAEALDMAAASDDERSKVALRLAGEYTQLVYLRDKARAENCKLADVAAPRIDVLRQRLSHDLASIFTTALTKRDAARIKQCLRTYDVIEGWAEAEEVVRDEFRAFCRKTLTAAAISAPLSPATPITPASAATPSVASALTPTRPPPAVSGRLNPDTPLATVYNQTLAEVESYASLLNSANGVSTEFDFFSRVIWPEVAGAISTKLGHIIFAAGRPDELHAHYTTTHEFLSLLEALAPTPDSVYAMRTSPAFETFERRWQLPVYFQLRWKEIVSAFEVALATPTSAAAGLAASKDKDGFALAQSAATWEAFSRCWSPNTFIPELSHRFWRLSLQILSRYAGWLAGQNAALKSTDDDPSSEDAALRFCGSAVGDIDALTTRISGLGAIAEFGLPELPTSLDPGPFAKRIVAILQKRCAEPLKLVRSVASQLRGRPASAAIQPSYFVPTILRPLRTFLEPRPALRAAYGKEWAGAVLEFVLVQYAKDLASVRKTEDLLRRHRKSKGRGFSLFGAASSGGGDSVEDEEERFRAQMRADVGALAKDAKGLGADVEGMPAWAELLEVVDRPADDAARG